MIRRIAAAAVLFCTILPVQAGRQSHENGENAQPRGVQANVASAKDVRSDLDKMRTLLAQMQRNVAFVSVGDTPLKHQFELEIEMWQLLLDDMEKKPPAESR